MAVSMGKVGGPVTIPGRTAEPLEEVWGHTQARMRERNAP